MLIVTFAVWFALTVTDDGLAVALPVCHDVPGHLFTSQLVTATLWLPTGMPPIR